VFGPEEIRMEGPNVLIMVWRVGVLGRTISRAMRSASIRGMLWDLRREETVDLPVAIPPVNPTTGLRKNVINEGWEE
jgi:hypothetical protein